MMFGYLDPQGLKVSCLGFRVQGFGLGFRV